ncbi:MAG: HIT family protein [Candidatus Azobacteroides sp.]|nr:HIT family protein [Candidatus Azobacteroides sp.]
MTIFSKIIAGEIPSYKVAEDENFYAFLDINPMAIGHTLVVPKKEVDYIFDLDDNLLANMIVFAKKVAMAMEKALPCQRIGMSVIGLEVPHAHIHLIPINKESDMYFGNQKLKLEQEIFEETANLIAKNNTNKT